MPAQLLRSLYLSLLCLTAAAAEPMTIQLLPSLPSPQPVGTLIGLWPRVENTKKGTHAFRYSISVNGEKFRVVRDFSQEPSFVWSPILYEHQARIRVTVKNNDTNETGETDLPFQIVSRVHSPAMVSRLTHPLVALFSHAPCPKGSQIRVAFRPEAGGETSRTPLESCRGDVSSNLYVAGMRPDSTYQLRSEIVTGSTTEPGEWLPFHTGPLDGNFPNIQVPIKSERGSSAEPVLVFSLTRQRDMARAIATDLDGNVIWYLTQPGWLTRIIPGGTFLSIGEGPNSSNDMRRCQLIREYDLAGNVVRETNASRVAEQLRTYPIQSDCKKDGEQCVSGFHHDAIRLPNGHTLVVAGLERMMPAGTQGSKDRIDILGDLVIDLDEDFQVTWIWNAFDHMDLKRASLLDSKCKGGPGSGGCTPIFLADSANGWLHSNSLNYVPSDGSLLISMPEQYWVLKVDYRDGKGNGKVLWRLGAEGDFTAKTDDPEPWFSYQHDAGVEPATPNLLSILDNGRARLKNNPKAHTRGQVWKLDEKAKTAELIYNADLGVYSGAVGSAQKLADGSYTFEAGFLNPGPSQHGRAVETSKDGKVVYAQQVEGFVNYRSFRVADLYSAPVK